MTVHDAETYVCAAKVLLLRAAQASLRLRERRSADTLDAMHMT